jgi:hypothetical protein
MAAEKKVLQTLNMSSNTITGLKEPALDSDAATKKYVDDNIGSPDAADVTFTPAIDTFITPPAATTNVDNVDEALKWLFTYANDGKTNIAGVIGSPATSSDTFSTLKNYIQAAKNDLATLINRAEGAATVDSGNANQTLATLTGKLPEIRTYKQTVKFDLASNETYSISLNTFNGAYPTLNQLVFTVYRRVNDGINSEVVATFNNGDESNFIINDYIVFSSSKAKLKNTYVYNYDNSTPIKTVTFDASQFAALKDVTIDADTTTLTIKAQPTGQVLIPNGDIPINTSTVDSINSVTQVATTTGASSVVKYAISYDSGLRWYSWNGTSWAQINLASNVLTATEIGGSGMTGTTIAAITSAQHETLRNLAGNNPSTIKFAYFIQDTDYTNKSEIDSVTLNVQMIGEFRPDSVSYNGTGTGVPRHSMSYDQSTGVLTFNAIANDAFKFSYIDTP